MSESKPPPPPMRVAAVGFLLLVAVMGMGRFALTPQLPLMLAEGQVSLASAGLMASMNYVGYLVGSVWAMRLRRAHARWLRIGLWSAAGATVLSALPGGFAWEALLRFVAGLGGAWALITATSWTQERLALHAPRLAAVVFAGPGAGIFLTGVLAFVLARLHAGAALGWLVYGAVALGIAWACRSTLPRTIAVRAPLDTDIDPWRPSARMNQLLAAYSLAGFGYILPATFLSQMAHARFPGTVLADLFWPMFGGAAAIGVLTVSFFGRQASLRLRLVGLLLLQAFGVAAGIVLPGAGGLALSAILCGGCFLAIMVLAMNMGRAFAPAHVPRMVGLLTTGYATGQLLGPLASAASAHAFGTLTPALALAAAGLVLAAALVWRAGKPAAAQPPPFPQ